ncbi:hypothetical protein GC177_04975 [bacterium]|nr:hypothetical protein [bacterium]
MSFSYIELVKHSFTDLWREPKKLIKPVLLMIGGFILMMLIMGITFAAVSQTGSMGLVGGLAAFLGGLGIALVVMEIFVYWQRWILLGDSGVPSIKLSAKFLVIAFLFGLGAGVLFAIPATILTFLGLHPLVMALVLGIPIGYVMLRFAPGFTAISIGDPFSLRESWDMTQGHALRMFGASILMAIPFLIIGAVLGMFEGGSETGSPGIISSLIQFALSIVQILVNAGFWAHIYRELKNTPHA